MFDLLRGNWGYSIGVFPRSEVWSIILQWLPRSLEIMFLSMFIATFIGIKLGKISASHRNKPTDYTIRSLSYVGMSVPMFVIGYFLIIFCLTTGIRFFPFFGYKSPGIGNPPTITHSRIIDCLISGNLYLLFDYGLHLFLPMIGITIGQLVLISRQTRGSLISILQTDYIRTARAKGLPSKVILKRHALRNSFIPTLSSIMLGFPKVLGGYIAVEVVFDLKGIGQMFYMALIMEDYNIMLALMYVFALIVILFGLIGELLYAVIDPRIKYR
jgi:peptide/nickel transport system permease protein